ncbi:hypothetical protein [Candidatus Clostridium helianthi]|jgi:hypothetical protein|uniref:Uncharacterized protein n=1 Tax=Candidatus Clostridium helianthi TaxID=3381660 RepID=A0ABW8RZG2_9CLOT
MENKILEILKQIKDEQIKSNERLEQLEEGQKRIEKKLDSVHEQTANLTKLDSKGKLKGGLSMTEYKEEILQKAFERGYQRGVKLAKLWVITSLLMQGYDQDLIAKVTEASADEIELVEIAIRMFENGEDIYYVARYTKLEIEEVERIKDCAISEKKHEFVNRYSLFILDNVIFSTLSYFYLLLN